MKSITFKRTREVVEDVELCAGVHGEGCLPATLDDLRKACEAVGLHVVEKSVTNALGTEFANLRAQLAELSAEHRSMVAASLRELEVLRGQLAAAEALTEATRASWQEAIRMRDALTSPEGRATDGDLEAMADEGYRLRSGWNVTLGDMRKLARAVAARVRRERPACLVERLVAEKAKFSAFERESDATWTVHVCLPGTGGYTTNVTDLPAADVPTTLARLAGLDGGR